ncbi:MAG: hypothetical protein KC466_01335 [Myxococcales bacterium]|nr:hypothetical protein [Myxococcales bacterium]
MIGATVLTRIAAVAWAARAPLAELGRTEDALPLAEFQQALLRRVSLEDVIPYILYGVLIIFGCLIAGWVINEYILNAHRRVALRALERSVDAGGIDIPTLEKLTEDPELLKLFLSRLRERDPDKARVYAVIASEMFADRRAKQIAAKESREA